jgi:hypothetical protein
MIRIAKSDHLNSGAPRIESVTPEAALPGGEIELSGSALGPVAERRPLAVLDGSLAPVLLSRPTRMSIRVPESAEAGRLEVRQNGATSNSVTLKIGKVLAENVNPVASPAVDAEGNVYTTLSGQRGEKMPVSIYRISPAGDMDSFATDIVNPTGLAIDMDGVLYVSSRHEGTIHRITPEGASSIFVESMGVATGLAFDSEGNLYCGDRSGTIFKIARDRQIFVFATLEPSVSAYHLAFGLDGTLFVSGPTTSSNDAVHAIDHNGSARVYYRGLGRPQGMAVDIAGSHRGRRGVLRLPVDRAPEDEPEIVISGSGIVGLAFSPSSSAIVATHNAIYDVALGVEGLRFP